MAKALSLNEIRSRAAGFVVRWRDAEGYERGEAQLFVRDLLAVYGITATRAGLYEKRVTRSSTGGRGYVDALVPGVAAIEMKSVGKDLSLAEQQLLDYLDFLSDAEMPGWAVTSDFKRFRVLDLTQADADLVVEFTLEEFPANVECLAFLAGYGRRQFGSAEQERASVQAARLMAGLYEELEGSGCADLDASVFLVRTLFALYADDAGVWERDLFYEFLVTRTAEDGTDLGPQLAMLFQVMATPAKQRSSRLDELITRFPYVNGGVFDTQVVMPALDKSMRERLVECCRFDWSAISPAVFGSLFQAVKSNQARRELGEHYTTEANILKLINPMFMDGLRQRLADAAHDAATLRRLRADLGKKRFLDPACGCGNFLVTAYRELRALDLQILLRLQELQPGGKEAGTLFFTEQHLPVTLDHFVGIEIDGWPARIAATALHLVEHQANMAMELALGQGPETLPLDKVETIHTGNALTMDWGSIVPETDQLYIFGNPPFIGQYTKTSQQTADMKLVWGSRWVGYLDYVTGWYAKTIELFSRPGFDGEFAFVSTNSITQGEPVPALFGPLFEAGWRVKFAHRTFAWSSEAPGAAAVHCVIIGFDKHPRSPAWIYNYPDPKGQPHRQKANQRINGYLIDGPNILVRSAIEPISPVLPKVGYGSKPTDNGKLLVDIDSIDQVRSDSVAAEYLRRFVGARELIHDLPRWCLWLTDLDPRDINRSPIVAERIAAVRQFREASSKAATRKKAATPQLFDEIRPITTPYLAIPSHVSETRWFFPAARFGPEVICGNANFQTPDPDGLAFAVVSSSMFITWQRAVGGRLKSDLRFSNTLVWNTFPLPALTPASRTKLIEAGQGVLAARALHPERSLADHYNPLAMSPDLLRAHKQLDKVVDRIIGPKTTCADNTERLTPLFAAYARLTTETTLKIAGRPIQGN